MMCWVSVLFIGSPGVGKLVMRGASETLTPVILELGGKDAFVVCDDADLDHCIVLPLTLTLTVTKPNPNPNP